MTLKEKAEALYFTYYQLVADGPAPEYHAKQCALIAVDEILNIIDAEGYDENDYKMIYWQQVKQEIENL